MIHRAFARAGWIAELRDYWPDFAIAYPRMAEALIRDGTALVTCEELYGAKNMGVYLLSEWMVESDIDSATLEQLNHHLESWGKQAGFVSLDPAKQAVRDLFVEQDKHVESRRKAR
jgi:hypothetical protein